MGDAVKRNRACLQHSAQKGAESHIYIYIYYINIGTGSPWPKILKAWLSSLRRIETKALAIRGAKEDSVYVTELREAFRRFFGVRFGVVHFRMKFLLRICSFCWMGWNNKWGIQDVFLFVYEKLLIDVLTAEVEDFQNLDFFWLRLKFGRPWGACDRRQLEVWR